MEPTLLPPMALRPFALERFFAKYEFNSKIKHFLCCSDGEPLTVAELLSLTVSNTDAHTRWTTLSLGYTEPPGLWQLRHEIASYHYSTFSADNILVAAPQEAIFLLMHALLEPGDLVICQNPCYPSLYEIARGLGANVEFWNARSDNGRLVFDAEHLAELVKNKPVKLVVCNTPHNPTGWVPSFAEFSCIRRCCQSSSYPGGAYLFCDEIYRGLEWPLDEGDSDGLPPAAEFYPERGISFCGLSKTVGMPGIRIGWLASSNQKVLSRVAHLKDYTTICNSAPSEILALMSLRAWDSLISRQMAIIKNNLDCLDAFMAKWNSIFQWQRPHAGTVAFPSVSLPEGVSVDELCSRLADEYGILLLPGNVYANANADCSVCSGRVRFGFGRANFPGCLAALEVALNALGL